MINFLCLSRTFENRKSMVHSRYYIGIVRVLLMAVKGDKLRDFSELELFAFFQCVNERAREQQCAINIFEQNGMFNLYEYTSFVKLARASKNSSEFEHGCKGRFTHIQNKRVKITGWQLIVHYSLFVWLLQNSYTIFGRSDQ